MRLIMIVILNHVNFMQAIIKAHLQHARALDRFGFLRVYGVIVMIRKIWKEKMQNFY
jgi:hypothetical protein